MSDTIKAIKVERKSTARLPHIDEQPTLLQIPVIPKSPPVNTEKLISQMFFPPSRPNTRDVLCFEIRDTQANTMDLMEEVVKVCIKELKKYPFKIVLSQLRYLAMYRYIEEINKQSSIKLVCAEGIVDYDVMAVCEAI
jgi:protocatechuate 3,4-dioxygenase beta subunit